MTEVPIVRSLAAPGTHLCGLAWDGRLLWHSDGSTDRIYGLDPKTGDVVTEYSCPDVRTDLAFDGESLWQIAGHPKRIRVIDPSTGDVLRDHPIRDDRERWCGLSVTGGRYWIGLKEAGLIEVRSVTDDEVESRYGALDHVDGIAVVGDTIWYTSYGNRLLVGIEVGTGSEVARYGLAGNPTGMCFDGSNFWYCDYENDRIRAVRVERTDPTSA